MAASQADARRQTGNEGNQERIAQLRQGLNADPDVTAIDKRIINNALDVLALPLGSDPVRAAEAVEEAEGRVANKQKATQYLEPYVERVRLQQKKPLSNELRGSEARKKPEQMTSGDMIVEETNAAMFDPIDNAEYEDTVYYHGTASAFKEFDASQEVKKQTHHLQKLRFGSQMMSKLRCHTKLCSLFGVPQRLVRDAQAKEHDAQLEQTYGNPEKAQRLFAEAEDLMQQAEDFELRQNRDPDARERGQTVIPVRVPKNLMVVDIGGESYYSGKISKFITEAKEKGFDGVKFLNLDDAVGLADRPATHIAIFDPAKIRSKFAPQQDVNQDADITINNMEEMDRVANHARGATLRKD